MCHITELPKLWTWGMSKHEQTSEHIEIHTVSDFLCLFVILCVEFIFCQPCSLQLSLFLSSQLDASIFELRGTDLPSEGTFSCLAASAATHTLNLPVPVDQGEGPTKSRNVHEKKGKTYSNVKKNLNVKVQLGHLQSDTLRWTNVPRSMVKQVLYVSSGHWGVLGSGALPHPCSSWV